MSKYVSENTDFKVILSGEGADELFGGYLYFHNAPSDEEFHNETQHLLSYVHKYDVLRADRCTAGHGLELRVPFFDKSFRNYINHIHPMFKRPRNGMEKYILRKAFDIENYLPESILYRQKNGMSDAVGYTWVDFIRNYANKQIDDASYEAEISVRKLYTKNPPVSKEELMYRKIYEKFYGNIDLLPHVWRPKYTDVLDPSAKMLKEFCDVTQ
jgi:asparagine synthase (glutamine-hydrolysing)